MSEPPRQLGGQLCNSVFVGASDKTIQMAVQLDLNGEPHSFAVLDLNGAEQLHTEIGNAIAKLKARLQ